jgi:hypothetical protein
MGETGFATPDLKDIHIIRSRRGLDARHGQAAAEARRDHH